MRLTDICGFQGGTQPPKSEWSFEKKEGYIRMLQIRDFTQPDKNVAEYIKYDNNIKICEKDDILIARYGASIGKIVTGLSGAYNVALMRTIPDTRIVLKKYLYYYLKSSYFQNRILNVGSRAAQAGFNQDDLSKLNITCPDLGIQKQIIYKLDCIQNIIKSLKEQLELLDELTKARFVEMFGDPIINDKYLPMRNLSSLSILKAGKAIRTGELVDESNDNLYPCYGGNGIRGFIDRYSNEGDLPIIGRQGAWAGNVNFASGKFYATEHAIVATPVIDLNTTWYYYALKLLDLTRFQTGAAQPGLAVDKLKRINIPFPPIEPQNQFAEFVHEVDKSRLVNIT